LDVDAGAEPDTVAHHDGAGGRARRPGRDVGAKPVLMVVGAESRREVIVPATVSTPKSQKAQTMLPVPNVTPAAIRVVGSIALASGMPFVASASRAPARCCQSGNQACPRTPAGTPWYAPCGSRLSTPCGLSSRPGALTHASGLSGISPAVARR